MKALARFTCDSRLVPATAAEPGFFEVNPFSDSRDIPVPAARILGLQNFAF